MASPEDPQDPQPTQSEALRTSHESLEKVGGGQGVGAGGGPGRKASQGEQSKSQDSEESTTRSQGQGLKGGGDSETLFEQTVRALWSRVFSTRNSTPSLPPDRARALSRGSFMRYLVPLPTTAGARPHHQRSEPGRTVAGSHPPVGAADAPTPHFEPIRGSTTPELAIAVRAGLEQLRGSSSGLQAFFHQAVAPTFLRLEAEGTRTQVELTDVMADSLRRAPPWEGAAWADWWIPRLRGAIEVEREPTADWWGTLGSMGDVLGVVGEARALQSATYYYELLLDLAEQLKGLEGPVPPDWLRALQVTTNNLAGRIADYSQTAGAADRENPLTSDVLRSSMAVSTGAALLREGVKSELIVQGPVEAWLANRWAEGSADQLLLLLDRIGMVPAAMGAGLDAPSRTYLDAVAALGRVYLGVRHRVAAGFFNAGVELQKSSSGAGVLRTREMTLARLALYGLGLWWCLRLYPEQMVQRALLEGDGLECLTNLVGSAADLSARQEQSLPAGADRAFTTFAGVVPQLLGAAGDAPRGDQTRALLTGSFRMLGYPPPTPQAPEPTLRQDALDALSGLVLGIQADLLRPGLPLDADIGDRVVTGDLVFGLLEEVALNRDPERIATVRGTVDGQALRFAEVSLNPVQAFLDLIESWSAGPEPGYGPLRAAGLANQEEWEELWSARIVVPPSLGAAVAEVPEFRTASRAEGPRDLAAMLRAAGIELPEGVQG